MAIPHTDTLRTVTRACTSGRDTFLRGLVEGGSQQGRGVEAGTVLQEDANTSSTPTSAGVKEGGGPICRYDIYL